MIHISALDAAIKAKKFQQKDFNQITFDLDKRIPTQLQILNEGNFGLVLFGTTPANEKVAIKVYHEQDASRENIYKGLSKYLNLFSNKYFVPAFYYNDGIEIAGKIYPALKMRFVEGKSLGYHIQTLLHSQNKDGLGAITKEVIKLAENLHKNGIAHRDIHSSNIKVNPDGSLTLIDYDDVWVNGHVEIESPTKGNREYQHPIRMQQSNFRGDYFDNFGFGLIYIQLQLFISTLEHHKDRQIDDSLLFSANDFQNLDRSKEIVWYAKGTKTANWMAILINDLICSKNLAAIPPLTQQEYNKRFVSYAHKDWKRKDEFYCPKEKLFF